MAREVYDCEFCGAEAELLADGDFDEDDYVYFVQCTNCGRKSGKYADHEKAVDEWNGAMARRADWIEHSERMARREL